MLFKINIRFTEEDYLAFNTFHSFKSAQAKKQIRKSCFSHIAITAFIVVLVISILGWTTFSIVYSTLLGLYTILRILLLRKRINRNIKSRIKQLKEKGKLPFDPESTLEFYEDKLVEITPAKRTEQNYTIFERICIVKDRYIFLYFSSVGAYTLPLAQVNAQVNLDDLLSFLAGKRITIEYY